MYKHYKVILITPCFANADLFNASREHLKDKLTPGLIDEFWVLGNKYPLPTVKENDDKLKAYALSHNYTYFDSGYDRGLHDSLNNFLSVNPQPANTIHIGFDSDSKTLRAGFDQALVEVVAEGNPVVSLWNLGMDINSVKRFPIEQCQSEIAGHKVYVHPRIEMFNITAFDLDFIKKVGGYSEPYKYYGGIESWIQKELMKYNKKMIYLMDFKEDYEPYPVGNSPLLREWKDAHLRGCTFDFARWLKEEKGIITS